VDTIDQRERIHLSRRSLLVSAAAAVSVLVTACGGGNAATATPGGSTPAATATNPAGATASGANTANATVGGSKQLVMASYTGPPAEWLKASIKPFTDAHPGVTITQNIFTDGANYKSTAAQLFASSDTPDIAWYYVEAQSTYNAMVKDKVIVPLDDIWKDNGLEAALDPATVKRYAEKDGHRYAIPVSQTTYGMLVYNEASFAKAGITDVTRQPTITQFMGWAEKLRGAGIEPLSAGGKEGFVLGWLYNIYMQRQLGDEKLNKLRTYVQADGDTSVTYKDPDNVAVLQLLKSFADKKVFAEGDLARTHQEAQGVFLQQRAAMYQVIGDDVAAILGQLPDGLKLNWFLHPSLKESVPAKFLVYDGFALMVPAKGKQQAVAKDFIKFHTTKDRQEALIKQFKVPFPRTDVSAEALQAIAPILREINDLSIKVGGQFPWASSTPGPLFTRTTQLIQELLAGSRSPDDVANIQEQEAQKLRKGI